MLVKVVMSMNPNTVKPQDTLRTTIERMALVGCRRLPVMLKERLVAIVADLDIREALNSPFNLGERRQDEDLMDHFTVEACLTPDPITVALIRQ